MLSRGQAPGPVPDRFRHLEWVTSVLTPWGEMILRRELGPNGVTVNSVAPGLIDTDITGGALEGKRKTQLVAGIPVGRAGNVNDVADLITYLCREESGYITGAIYDVNGGSHIH